MPIVIETGVSIPRKRSFTSPAVPEKQPWMFMNVGDSVFFECEKKDISTPKTAAFRFSANFRRHQNRYPALKLKFVRRKVEGGIRIWRTA